MKILELNFERTWRGGERQTLYNATGFINAGHEVALLCRGGFPLEAKVKEQGITTHSFNNIFSVLLFLIFKGNKYDVMHVQTSHILTYVVFTKMFHGGKVIFTRRVDFVPKGKLTRMKYRMADVLVGVSNAVKNIVENFSGKDVVVISDVVMPMALNKEKATEYLQRNGIDTDKHIIGTTAALVPHKDPLTMVAAIKELYAIRQDFIFLHFGDGVLMEEVKSKVIEYGLQAVYRLCGFVDGVEDMFTMMEVFVMSSQEEGLGSSVLDAYQYGVPVVTTNAGGLKDITSNGQAVVCEVKGPQNIAKGMDNILHNCAAYDDMTAKAKEYVKQYHSLEYITAQYLQLIN